MPYPQNQKDEKMNLKACFVKGKGKGSDGNAIIYEENGPVIYRAPAADANQARVLIMANAEVRKMLTEKYNTIKLKLDWTDVLPVEEAAVPVEPAPEPAPGPVEPAERRLGELVDLLRESDDEIEAEMTQHKEIMKALKDKQEKIKKAMYESRDKAQQMELPL